jgi:hypothetical protein
MSSPYFLWHSRDRSVLASYSYEPQGQSLSEREAQSHRTAAIAVAGPRRRGREDLREKPPRRRSIGATARQQMRPEPDLSLLLQEYVRQYPGGGSGSTTNTQRVQYQDNYRSGSAYDERSYPSTGGRSEIYPTRDDHYHSWKRHDAFPKASRSRSPEQEDDRRRRSRRHAAFPQDLRSVFTEQRSETRRRASSLPDNSGAWRERYGTYPNEDFTSLPVFTRNDIGSSNARGRFREPTGFHSTMLSPP